MTMDERPIDPDRLRRFDRNLLDAGHELASRVLEPTPFCWFCGRTEGTRSKEHIFPQWLLKHHGAMDERVHPIRISLPLGGVVASERGERPLRAHFNGEVCADCNNGWMSALEVRATPILAQEQRLGEISDGDATILARWFAKTAVNLNVSQPFRLIVDAPARHGLSTGIPDGFAVHLFRSQTQDSVFDWVQKSPDAVSCPQDQLGGLRSLMELTLVTHIRIADLVAVVIYAPGPLRLADITPSGTTRIYPLSDVSPTWEGLPHHEDYLGPFTLVDVR